jgi:hypothetical protein
MAMPRKINIQFGEVFPHGVYAVSEVTQVRDFDRSRRTGRSTRSTRTPASTSGRST